MPSTNNSMSSELMVIQYDSNIPLVMKTWRAQVMIPCESNGKDFAIAQSFRYMSLVHFFSFEKPSVSSSFSCKDMLRVYKLL